MTSEGGVVGFERLGISWSWEGEVKESRRLQVMIGAPFVNDEILTILTSD